MYLHSWYVVCPEISIMEAVAKATRTDIQNLTDISDLESRCVLTLYENKLETSLYYVYLDK